MVSNKTAHARFQKKGRDGYIPLKEVGGHDLAVSQMRLFAGILNLCVRAKHDAWVVIDGEVWDVTNFLKSHVSNFPFRPIHATEKLSISYSLEEPRLS